MNLALLETKVLSSLTGFLGSVDLSPPYSKSSYSLSLVLLLSGQEPGLSLMFL